MKDLLCIICIILVVGCSSNDEASLRHDIKEYQGIWRDTIFSANDVYIEDLIIDDNSLQYTLTDASTHVVLDTLSGTIIVGNENRIGWNCFSHITNEIRQSNWSVLYLSTYQMRLYSSIMGERSYRRVYHPTIENFNMQDTLSEMLNYKKYLPLHRNNLIAKFGDYNRLPNCDGISYFTHHPLFDKISFPENFDNDSIYSFSLSVKDWEKCFPIIESHYTKFRDINATTEYIDSESLETSENVVITDPSTKQISFKPIKDYDYWPNVSRYIGKTLHTFMDDYQAKFVYRFHENAELGLFEYYFQVHKDSICSEIFVVADTAGIILQSGVYLINVYMSSRKKNALNELDKISLLLRKKYFLDKEGVDENGNKVFYYYPSRQKEKSPYEIKLRLRQYSNNNITKLYQVAIYYIIL